MPAIGGGVATILFLLNSSIIYGLAKRKKFKRGRFHLINFSDDSFLGRPRFLIEGTLLHYEDYVKAFPDVLQFISFSFLLDPPEAGKQSKT